jgi:hypothetical protein
MLFLTLYILGLSALIQILIQYPHQSLIWGLRVIKRFFPLKSIKTDNIDSVFAAPPTKKPLESVFAAPIKRPLELIPSSCCDTPPRSSSDIEPPRPFCRPDFMKEIGKNQPLSFDEKLDRYEQEHQTKVIFINHKEIKGMFGSSYESLGESDAQTFIDIMRTISPHTHITLVLKTNGGELASAEVIVHALLNHPGKISVYIPYSCMSAGTLIALTADEIYMDPNAYCGPIDPQKWGISVTSVINFCRKFSNSNSLIGDLAKLALGQAEAAMSRIQNVVEHNTSWDDDTLMKIEEELISGKYNHDKPLFVEDMRQIIPEINSGLPEDLMDLYQSFLKKPSCSPPSLTQQILGF